MNIIRVVSLNDDGSVKFEGDLGPNEVKFLLETGVNFLLQQGAIGVLEDEEDDEDDETFVIDEDPTNRH